MYVGVLQKLGMRNASLPPWSSLGAEDVKPDKFAVAPPANAWCPCSPMLHTRALPYPLSLDTGHHPPRPQGQQRVLLLAGHRRTGNFSMSRVLANEHAVARTMIGTPFTTCRRESSRRPSPLRPPPPSPPPPVSRPSPTLQPCHLCLPSHFLCTPSPWRVLRRVSAQLACVRQGGPEGHACMQRFHVS